MSGTWAWQFEGHHVSINHLIIDGEVAASTPLFLGASPAMVKKGSGAAPLDAVKAQIRRYMAANAR